MARPKGGWIDCESYESALTSISKIYAASSDSIENYLSHFDLEDEFEAHKVEMDANDLLKLRFDQNFGSPRQPVTGISWFHLTRTSDGTRFSEGILPLGEALPKVWDMLASILKTEKKKQRLRELRANGVQNFQFNHKVPQKLLHGPYAMLVRESAFRTAEIGNHDYLEVPEIIEDICWGYQEQFRESIQEEITAALRPCIVKFEDRSRTQGNVIGPVLQYCLCKARNEELHLHANTCFDGGCVAVPFESIEKIEFLDHQR